jgi:hypothetical protein
MDEDGLRQYLNGLECQDETPTQNILVFGLAPFLNQLVATTTFQQEPLIFVKCRPGCRLPVQLSSELGGATIIIDCDFDGITPLHYPLSKPKYE